MEASPETQETRKCVFDELDQIRENLFQIQKAINYSMGRCGRVW